MSELFRLIPNPSGDRKTLKFELTVLESFEELWAKLADRSAMVQFLANVARNGSPPDNAQLQEILAGCEIDRSTIPKILKVLRQRKAQVRERLAKADRPRAPERA